MGSSRNPVALRSPKRAANAGIAGYHYQFAYTALQWLRCKEGETIYCEANEDLDRIGADGSTEEAQVKHLSGQIGPTSKIARRVLSDFAKAFCEHHAAKRTCSLVFVCTAEIGSRRNTPLFAWMSGKKHTCDSLVSEITTGDIIPTEFAHYLNETSAWATFIRSVKWQFGSPTLERFSSDLLRRISASNRTFGLDPSHVRAVMTERILERSGKPNIQERALSRLDLDLLLNDLWLAKSIDDYGPTAAVPKVYISLSSPNRRPGRVCLGLLVDNEPHMLEDFASVCRRQQHMPGGIPIHTLKEMNESDLCEYLRGTGFDVYAIVDTRHKGCTAQDLVFELVPFISAREPAAVEVVGQALLNSVRSAPERFPFLTSSASATDLGPSIAATIADSILEAFAQKRLNAVLRNAIRKIRVIGDIAEGRYYTQADPPPWIS
jgi:hypothetical protein